MSWFCIAVGIRLVVGGMVGERSAALSVVEVPNHTNNGYCGFVSWFCIAVGIRVVVGEPPTTGAVVLYRGGDSRGCW